MSVRTQRHEIRVPLRRPVVGVLLGIYFLASGAVGVLLGRDMARALDGLAPPLVVACLFAGVFTVTAGLVLTRARVLAAMASRIQS